MQIDMLICINSYHLLLFPSLHMQIFASKDEIQFPIDFDKFPEYVNEMTMTMRI